MTELFPLREDPPDAALVERIRRDAYPRANTYDPRWMLDNLMGPNVIWLTEALTGQMRLTSGMRVLDLGCGRAISSIFLAREFDVQVWAADLWIEPHDNWARIQDAGIEDRVFPLHADARALPFAHGFFDAIISLDAYHYFGTDDLYLQYLAPFLRSGGQLGIVSPGLAAEVTGSAPPAGLEPWWVPDFWSFHSPDWWRHHLTRTGGLAVHTADRIPNGAADWQAWHEICRDFGYSHSPNDLAMLEADAGATLGFTRLVATKP